MKDRNAFNQRSGICYVPEAGDCAYTYQAYLQIAKGNPALALILFDLSDLQHPETIFDELEREGEIDENGNVLDPEYDYRAQQLIKT